MGIRTQRYVHVPRVGGQAQQESQPPQAQPNQPGIAANDIQNQANGPNPAPIAGPSRGKPKKGKARKGKGKGKKVSPPTAMSTEMPAREEVPQAVAVVVPPPKAVAGNGKKGGKKRKQKEKVKVVSLPMEAGTVGGTDQEQVQVKVEALLNETPTLNGGQEQIVHSENAVGDTGSYEGGDECSTSKGDLKDNRVPKPKAKVKKGVRHMMERTNKILERSRNCKKPTRKKSPVKPRVLPARASARLCVLKNSGEFEPALHPDQPLRTVELIKRPLELRDPATKLLYLASLSLYPKADPDSDSTPIVIINEEIPNPLGKRPKVRSVELPLLPNWKNSNSHVANGAASSEPLNVNLSLSPNSRYSEEKQTEVKKKPARPRKGKSTKTAAVRKVVPKSGAKTSRNVKRGETPECAGSNKTIQSASSNEKYSESLLKVYGGANADTVLTSGNDLDSSHQLVKDGLSPPKSSPTSVKSIVSGAPTPSGPALGASRVVSRPRSKVDVQRSSNGHLASSSSITVGSSVLSYSLSSGLTISPATPPKAGNNNSWGFNNGSVAAQGCSGGMSKSPSSIVDNGLKVNSEICNSHPKASVSLQSADSKVTQKIPHPSVIKRKRKSLETIIKEIPKAKVRKADVPVQPVPVLPPKPHSLPNMTEGSHQSTSSILEGLMKNPVRQRKPKAPQNQSLLVQQELLQIPNIGVQDRVSMTVPLQPAPVASSTVSPLIRESPQTQDTIKKPTMKNQIPKFQLPMPLPIPLPPGVLSYASFDTRGNFQTPNASKPKRPRPRKPKTQKVVDSFGRLISQGINSVPTIRNPSQSNMSGTGVPYLPNLPSHLQAFYRPLPLPAANGFKDTLERAESTPMREQSEQSDALDLCVKIPSVVPTKKVKKVQASPNTKSLLKPLNVEEEGPLNLVMGKSSVQTPAVVKKADVTASGINPLENSLKQQGNLENVKQMLARLHTKIAPAVNGVQLITIE